jgi:N-glycosylase/DNA lyase
MNVNGHLSSNKKIIKRVSLNKIIKFEDIFDIKYKIIKEIKKRF